uniref:Uncharacterized protein n=1 Tax=Cacopsylla melanoneura TaxID=428564 RepID=A0A8D8ZTS5_9HEMI
MFAGVECREIPRGQLFLRMLASEGTINKKLNDMEKYLLMFGPFSPEDNTIFQRDRVKLPIGQLSVVMGRIDYYLLNRVQGLVQTVFNILLPSQPSPRPGSNSPTHPAWAE